MNQREEFFKHMAQEHGLTMLDSEMDAIQHILFPPSYPYNIDDTMLSKLSKHELIKLKSEIAHRIRNFKEATTKIKGVEYLCNGADLRAPK